MIWITDDYVEINLNADPPEHLPSGWEWLEVTTVGELANGKRRYVRGVKSHDPFEKIRQVGVEFSDMIGLEWTTEPPVVRGMYQAAFSDGSGVVWFDFPADCGKYDPADFSHYLGPIPVADIP